MRRRASKRRAVAYASAIVVGLAGLYLAFELGRFQAGYSLFDHSAQLKQQSDALAAERAAAEDLRRQVAILETSREIDRETYEEIEASLGDLQATIQSQEEELVFYRGIVSPQDGVPGLRVQSLEVVPQDAERRYRVQIVLVQAIVHSSAASGVVKLAFEGVDDGQDVSHELADLMIAGSPDEAPATPELAYEFRYFQGLEAEVELPVGFEPVQVHLEVVPKEPRGDSVLQSYDWADALN